MDSALAVHLINGYVSLPGTSFNVIRFGGARSGDFASVQNLTPYAGLRFLKTYDASGLTLTASGLPGDANLDGMVDTLDFNALAANFGGTGKTWLQADFNGDDVVDTLDFNNLAANFGKTTPPETDSSVARSATVPEPTALAICAGGLASLATWRMRRCRGSKPAR